MNEGEEVRKGKSVFRLVILLMAVAFTVMAGNTGIHAAQVGEVNGNDTTEIVNPTVTPEPDITITPEATPIVKKRESPIAIISMVKWLQIPGRR